MGKFKDKTVLITGGGLGIGKCVALAFAGEGANVHICSRTTQDLQNTLSEAISGGGKCAITEADVSQYAQVQKWVESVYNREGRIDILINNAGIYGPIGLLEENNLLEWQKTMEINLFGTVFVTRAVLPYMKQQKRGKIINMAGAGVGSANLAPNFSAYVSSKAGVAAFTEVMALELKDWNIQVNAVSPGAVNTRFLDQVLEAGESAGENYYRRSKKQKAEGGTPPELTAKLALFLAGEESDFITGKILSAKWDDYETLSELRDKVRKSSFLNLRRIDNRFFYEKS